MKLRRRAEIRGLSRKEIIRLLMKRDIINYVMDVWETQGRPVTIREIHEYLLSKGYDVDIKIVGHYVRKFCGLRVRSEDSKVPRNEKIFNYIRDTSICKPWGLLYVWPAERAYKLNYRNYPGFDPWAYYNPELDEIERRKDTRGKGEWI